MICSLLLLRYPALYPNILSTSTFLVDEIEPCIGWESSAMTSQRIRISSLFISGRVRQYSLGPLKAKP
jgi:hypothetical protein